jgi:hypothetical protein
MQSFPSFQARVKICPHSDQGTGVGEGKGRNEEEEGTNGFGSWSREPRKEEIPKVKRIAVGQASYE